MLRKALVSAAMVASSTLDAAELAIALTVTVSAPKRIHRTTERGEIHAKRK